MLFAPLLAQQLGLQLGVTLDSVTAAAEATAPKMAVLALLLVGIALAAGAVLHAVGHERGQTMVKNSLVAAVILILGAAFFSWLSKQGPSIASDLVAQVGNMITNAAAWLQALSSSYGQPCWSSA